MADADSDPKKQIMDVSKPGKIAPSATSRPVIIGHGTLLKDPMVKSDDPEEGVKSETSNANQPTSSRERTITPLNEDTKPEEDENEPSEQPAEDKEKPEKEDDVDTGDGAVVDAVADQVNDKKKKTKEEEARIEENARLQKLVDEKKYFVTVGGAKRRKNAKRLGLILFLVILLATAGLLLALDAGIIKSSIKPPFDIIKDSEDIAPVATIESASSQETSAAQSAADEALEKAKAEPDSERQKDLGSINTLIKEYFRTNGKYPSFKEMNDESFRTELLAQMSDLVELGVIDKEIFRDPSSNSYDFVAFGGDNLGDAVGQYGYAAQSSTTAVCDNETTDCIRFSLVATLSDGKIISHQN